MIKELAPFPIPHNERERLKALDDYNILDTLDEAEFDRLTELASIICDVPISLVSLVIRHHTQCGCQQQQFSGW